MTITYKELPELNVVELTVNGKITNEDYLRIAHQFEKFIENRRTIKVLEVVQTVNAVDPSVIWDGIKFDLKHLQDISHCAVVSDIGWISPFAKAAGHLISTKLRTFSLAQLDEARAWLTNPDT